jgi:hypothetical protein
MRIRLSRWHADVYHLARAGEHVIMGDLAEAIEAKGDAVQLTSSPVLAVETKTVLLRRWGVTVEFAVCFGCHPIRTHKWRRSWK